MLGLCCVGMLCLLFSKKIAKLVRLILLVVLFVSVVVVGVTNVLDRSDLSGLTGDDSSENRIEQWKAGVRMTLANPLLGVGRGEFQFRAVDYDGIRGLQPHNTIIQVFAETGILGGMFYVLFSVFPLLSGCKVMRGLKNDEADAEEYIVYRFLLISLTGFWVCAFFGNRYSSYILFIIISLISSVRGNIIGEKALLSRENQFNSK